MPSPKVLFIDIETFPNIAYVWGKYEQNVIRYLQQSCIATFSAKWLGDKRVHSHGLPDYPKYVPDSYDDKALVGELWKYLDEADVVVAHNGDDFDVRAINARFIFHGLTPPSPFKTVDTKKVAKRAGRFNSNSLDDLCEHFGLGRKIKTDFDLWAGCIHGDLKSWKRMQKYNDHDVIMLEALYLRLLPWAKNHPNMTQGTAACPKCGSEDIQWRGYTMSSTSQYKKFRCNRCGGWGRSVKRDVGSVTTNIA